jgi:beta-lactamase regulating signal transducer with metallopeptidase domain
MDAGFVSFLMALHVKAAVFTTLILALIHAVPRISSQNRYLVLRMALAVLAALPLLMLALPNDLIPFDWHLVSGGTGDSITPVIGNGATTGPESVATSAFQPGAMLLTAYLVVSLGLMSRVVVGFMRTAKETRGLLRLQQASLISLVEQVRQQLGVKVDVALVLDSASGPYAWGIRRHLIAVPENFLAAAPDIQRTVITHELTHILRRDAALCLFSKILCCLYWINPALWFLNARLKLEMEQSCDDRVVCSGIKAADYAGHLVNAIRQFEVTRPRHSVVAMARESSIKSRIGSLLNSNKHRGIMNTSKAASVGVALVLLVIALAASGAAPAAPNPEDIILANVKSLAPESCDTQLQDVKFDQGIMEFKVRCSTSSRVASFMRKLESAGGKPSLMEVNIKKTPEGVWPEYRLQLLNPQSLATASAPK